MFRLLMQLLHLYAILYEFCLLHVGLPYFPIINNRIQYGLPGKETNVTLNVVSNPKIVTISVYDHHSVLIEDVHYKIELSKIKDIVYGTTVNVKGYKLIVPIKINDLEDLTMYTVVITNDYGQCNISVDLRSASKYITEYIQYYF